MRLPWQDAVEISRATLEDAMGGPLGCIEVTGGRRGGKHKEAKRFMAALVRRAQQRGSALCSTAEMCELGDEIDLQVGRCSAAQQGRLRVWMMQGVG